MVAFDLSTGTKRDRKLYRLFRKDLLKHGYLMLQFSLYFKHVKNWNEAQIESKRVENYAPQTSESASIRIFHITEKQFMDMKIIYGKKEVSVEEDVLRDEIKGQTVFIF